MKFTFTDKKVNIPNRVHAYAEKKIGKLDRYFKTEPDVSVVFSVEKCPEWINNSLEVTEKEFNDALISSGAINLSNIETTNQFDWGWLNFVADIDDIIAENQRE